MAKIKNPSYIPESNGRMGDAVLYKRRGVQCVRSYVIPVNPDTEGQRKHRGSFKEAVKEWQMLSTEGKKNYNNRADAMELNWTGYNLFMSEYINRYKENMG
jgi:hypothetical protein